MRIIINDVEPSDLETMKVMLHEIFNQKSDRCGYVFKYNCSYFVKRTKSGFSIFKEKP